MTIDNYNQNQDFDPTFGLGEGSQDNRRAQGDGEHHSLRPEKNHHFGSNHDHKAREHAKEHRAERRAEDENLAVQCREMNASEGAYIAPEDKVTFEADCDHAGWENEGGACSHGAHISSTATIPPVEMTDTRFTADKLPMPFKGELGNDLPTVPPKGSEVAPDAFISDC